MRKDYLVTKSNNLITANYNLTLQEQKLILTLASMVQPNDSEFKEYELKVSDFMNLLDINPKSKSKYTEIPKITKELMKKVFEVKEGNDIVQLSWLSSARYKKGKGIVILKFDSCLKPYLLKLKEFYTTYKLENILSLKSKYSLRIFEILKSYEYKKNLIIDLNDFKKMIGATNSSYNIYHNLKIKILIKSQQELKEKTDINFIFEEIKTGRKITAIKFIINTNQKNESKDKLNDIAKLIILMREHDINFSEAEKIYDSANGNLDYIINIYNHFKNKPANNFIGLMIKMVKEGNFIPPKKTPNKFEQFILNDNIDYDEIEKKLIMLSHYEN